jgi:hypothetical protein
MLGIPKMNFKAHMHCDISNGESGRTFISGPPWQAESPRIGNGMILPGMNEPRHYGLRNGNIAILRPPIMNVLYLIAAFMRYILRMSTIIQTFGEAF